jgi:hypothetical protein
MTGILQTGADNLTLADMNEEGANLLMLEAQQNLALTELKMSAQSSEKILQLF